MNKNRKSIRSFFVWCRASQLKTPSFDKLYTPSIYKRYNNLKKYIRFSIALNIILIVWVALDVLQVF